MPSGYLEQDTDNYIQPVASPIGVDMWLTQDTDGYLMPLASELTPVFPSEDDTTTRASAYGWTGEFTGNFAFPTAFQVQDGVFFGAHGTEFRGAFVGGVTAAPTIPVIMVTNVGDGKAATAVIQNSDPGTTNRVYCQPIGHYQNPHYLGSVAGDGTLTVYPGYPATYVCYVMSTIGNSLSSIGISNYFELVGANDVRTELMAGPALAHLEICKAMGKRVSYRNLSSEPWIGLWCLDIEGSDTVTVHGGETSFRTAIIEVPRQPGWPPEHLNVQATFKIPEGENEDIASAVFGVENATTINANIGITPVHRVNLKRHDYDVRIGG